MARALKDIITELNSVYNPQRDLYNQQLGTVDPQMQAETQGLEAQKRDSFQQITDQANRRGLFYSGLPIAEEQRYTGQQFLPAIANLRAKYASQRFGLQDAIAKLTAEQYGKAQGIYQTELDRDAEMQRFREQMAAQERADARARAAAASSGGGGFNFGGGAVAAPKPVDPIAAARGLAKTRRDEYLASPNNQPFYREQVLRELVGMGIPLNTARDIIYKQVFPDNWANGDRRPAPGGGGGGAF